MITSKYISVLLAAIITAALTGCSSMQTLANGVSQKSISGSGTVAFGRVGLNTTTLTPEVQGLFVWGDYASVSPDGGEVVRFECTEDASVFNSACKTTRIKVFFASNDPSRVDKVVDAITAALTTHKQGE